MSDSEKMRIPVPQELLWRRLRGALKDAFTDLGGGEAYLRNEREGFYPPEDPPKPRLGQIYS